MYPFPALVIHLLLIPFTTEEIDDCFNEAAKGSNKAPRNLPSCFFISDFTVSVTPSINTPKSSNLLNLLLFSLNYLTKNQKIHLIELF